MEMENNIQQFIPAYEDMVKAGMHFGRKRTIFHPNMKPYVYGLKENIYLLDLIKTGDSLAAALDFIKMSLGEGKIILFVGTSKQSAGAVEKTARALNMPYVINRWLGGTLTNFKTIISRLKYLEDLEKKQAEGDFEKFTKKEKIMKEREINSLRQKFGGLRDLSRLPDVIFISSLKENQLPVNESKIAGVKVVGIVNTDSDPKQIDYPITANDNSRKSVELILEAIIRAAESLPAQAGPDTLDVPAPAEIDA